MKWLWIYRLVTLHYYRRKTQQSVYITHRCSKFIQKNFCTCSMIKWHLLFFYICLQNKKAEIILHLSSICPFRHQYIVHCTLEKYSFDINMYTSRVSMLSAIIAKRIELRPYFLQQLPSSYVAKFSDCCAHVVDHRTFSFENICVFCVLWIHTFSYRSSNIICITSKS